MLLFRRWKEADEALMVASAQLRERTTSAAQAEQAARAAAKARAAAEAALPPLREEEAIAAAVAGDMAPFQRLSQAISTPFALSEEHADLALAPSQDEAVTRTFCGT